MAGRYVLGNWKSHGSSTMLAEFAANWNAATTGETGRAKTGLALPFHLLSQAAALDGMWFGAQNVSAFGDGAYTGEISARMLAESGCGFALVGHSERRAYFEETPDDTGAKLARLWQAGVLPVLCIGETLEERRAGKLEEVLGDHLSPLAEGPSRSEPLVVAYEPVWAIGTGVAAQPEDVAGAHGLIKNLLGAARDGETAVLYGGSVKPANAGSLAAIDTVDGFLVGGASLAASDFAAIAAAFDRAKSGA